MKKIRIAIPILVFLPLALLAQNTKKVDIDSNKQQGLQIMLLNQMDQRKIYHWDNGQRSTSAGREAGEAPHICKSGWRLGNRGERSN
jgi:hypothetical protein